MAHLASLTAPAAVLQLLLKQGKSYEDLAGLLRTRPRRACATRAHDALDRSVPTNPGSAPSAATRSPTTCSASSPPPSAPRRASSSRARPPAAPGPAPSPASCARSPATALPEIPAEPAEVDEAFDALDRPPAQARAAARSPAASRARRPDLRCAARSALRRRDRRVADRDQPRRSSRRQRRQQRQHAADRVDRRRGPATPAGRRRSDRRQRRRSSPPPSALAARRRQRPAAGRSRASSFQADAPVRARLLQAKELAAEQPARLRHGVWLYTSPRRRAFLGFPRGNASVEHGRAAATVADLSARARRTLPRGAARHASAARPAAVSRARTSCVGALRPRQRRNRSSAPARPPCATTGDARPRPPRARARPPVQASRRAPRPPRRRSCGCGWSSARPGVTRRRSRAASARRAAPALARRRGTRAR